MSKAKDIVIAVKCAPEEKILSDAKRAELKAVELYLSGEMLDELSNILRICKKYSFRYAIHAPNNGGSINKLAKLADGIGAEVVVFHNIYWEDEWRKIVKSFKNIKAKICIENTCSVHEPLKFMRRYGFGKCLDLEHLQLECAGVYEEIFILFMKEAYHIHMTGYRYGSELWHTHIHDSSKHSLYLLNLLRKADYSGLVVSEAKALLQNYKEFKRLNDFYKKWQNDKI